MKFKISILLLCAGLFIASCGGDATESSEAEEVLPAEEKDLTYSIDLVQSTIGWTGEKLNMYEHVGSLKLSGGEINISDGEMVTGNFEIDMNSLVVFDDEVLQGTEDMNEKLTEHIKSSAFFNVDSFPTGLFEITGIEALSDDSTATHNISGNLTLRGITKNITFPAAIAMVGDNLTALAKGIIINRQDWGVRYQSAAGEVIINDNVKIEISITANK